MICPSCGCENETDVVYCDDCGAMLKKTDTSNSDEKICDMQIKAGQELLGLYKVVQVVKNDSVSGVYKLTRLADHSLDEKNETCPKCSELANEPKDLAESDECAVIKEATKTSDQCSKADTSTEPPLQSEENTSSEPGGNVVCAKIINKAENKEVTESPDNTDNSAEQNVDKNDLSQYLAFELLNNSSRIYELWELLHKFEVPSLWCPRERLEGASQVLLIGPWPGKTFREEVESGRSFETSEVIKIGIELSEALSLLHREGWLHKGISPDSVWMGKDGHSQIVLFERSAHKIEIPEFCSIVEGFSAPEVYGLLGGRMDARSDIFSLGALLYFLVSARQFILLDREINFIFPPLMPPGPLSEVIMKAVKRDPDERFSSCEEFAEALKQAQEKIDNPGLFEKSQVNEPQLGDTLIVPSKPKVCADENSGLSASGLPGFTHSVSSCRVGEYIVAAKSHVGAVRKVNQDAFLELSFSACEKDISTKVHLLAVIDGMGGPAEGDKAASLAARTIASEVMKAFFPVNAGKGADTAILLPKEPDKRNAYILQKAITAANRVIIEYASKDNSRSGMGCALSCALLENGRGTFAHVGDTRAYRINGTLPDQITTDHSLVGMLVNAGSITKEEARNHPHRNVILRAVGTSPEIQVDVYQRDINPGDYLMLSSDGVWEYFADDELPIFFSKYKRPEDICQMLVEKCLDLGANDNATVMVVYRSLK